MKRFKCPECGCLELEEVQTGMTQSVRVNGIDDDGYLDYGETLSIEGGEVSYYQCGRGHSIPGVSNDDQMIEWLNQNGEEVFPTGRKTSAVLPKCFRSLTEMLWIAHERATE